jgi:predicted transcriptional regulator
MKRVRLDLFKLCEEDEKVKGCIKVILTPALKKKISVMLKIIEAKEKIKVGEIVEKLGMKYSTFRMSIHRKRLPLIFIKKLVERYDLHEGMEIVREIKELSSGTGSNYVKVKAPKFLTENLCKIVGAIVADGNIYLGKGKRKWQIKIGDQYKDNLELFSKWIRQEFGISLKIKKDKRCRMFYIDFSNKIVFSYLHKIFDVKVGSKSSITGIPKIIKNSPFKYRRAFVVGLCMFDGGIGFERTYFCLSTKSKNLLREFNKILKRLKINYSSTNKPNRANKLYQTYVWSKSDLRKVLNYLLESNTTKWKQLKTLPDGLRSSNYKENLKIITALFPKVRRMCIGFFDVIKLFEESGMMTKKEVERKLNRSERTVRSLLDCLEKMSILKSKNENPYKVWYLNYRRR